MKKILVIMSTLLLSVSAIVFATDDVQTDDEYTPAETEELTEAPQEVINDAIDTCQSWAKGDDIQNAELESYLLSCVNSTLNEQGYSSVSSINN